MKFLELTQNMMNGQLEAYFDDWTVIFTDMSDDEIHPTIAVSIKHKSDWSAGKVIAVPEGWRDHCWARAHEWAIDFLEIIGVIDEIP